MRIFGIVALFVVSVAAKGSGPYLPSGWRPEGPAFNLPSEVEKPKESPIKDVIFQESIASGSDSFQEYGPPKVEVAPLELSKQGLPDVVTEQVFAVIEAKVQENVGEEVELAVTETQTIVGDSEGNLSQQSFVQEAVPVTEVIFEEATTPLSDANIVEEIQPAVEVTTQLVEIATAVESEEIKQNVAETPIYQVLVNENIAEVTQQENDNANSNIVSTFQERVQVEEIQTVKEDVQKVETEVKKVETEVQKIETQVQNFETEVKTIVHEVQNIPELLNSIDNDKQQIETVQDISAKVIQETFGTLEQAPEGFLEYGPPGFKEYGPPKEEIVPAAEVIQPVLQTIESNANRRRRFSPKFRTARKANRQ